MNPNNKGTYFLKSYSQITNQQILTSLCVHLQPYKTDNKHILDKYESKTYH